MTENNPTIQFSFCTPLVGTTQQIIGLVSFVWVELKRNSKTDVGRESFIKWKVKFWNSIKWNKLIWVGILEIAVEV